MCREGEKPGKEDTLLLIFVCLFFSFTFSLFSPYEIFLLNHNDFSFSFSDFWLITAAFSLVLLAVMLGIGICLRGRIKECYCVLAFSVTLCGYIQTMFLNGQMYSLVGDNIQWKQSTIVINASVWCSVFIGSFLICFLLRKHWKKIFTYLSAAIVIMQGVALLSLLFTQELKTEKNGYLSEKGMLEVSSEENVVFFIVDYFDGRYMDELLSEEEDFLNPLKGFTYFPNATSTYSRTYPSIPYLLTGEECFFDIQPEEYISSAYEKSIYWEDLVKQGIDIGLYTYEEYLADSAKTNVSNYVDEKLRPDWIEVIKCMMKMSAYRSAPYCLKSFFQYDADDINNRILRSNKEKIEKFHDADDEHFYNELLGGIMVTDADKVFRFYHLRSCHEDLSNPVPYGKRSLQIIYEYISQLQKLQVYDKTTIIITADHGYSGGGDTLDMPHGTAVPLMIVKPKSATEKEDLKISNAPVSHEDLLGTVLAGFECKEKAFPYTVFDFSEGENRERYYNYSALYSDEEGEVELRKYLVSGDARDWRNYHFTGNVWPIIYSFNRVSK